MFNHAFVGAILLATSISTAAQTKPRLVRSYDAIINHLPTDKKTCLVRKATGKVECRTQSEWRDIAAEFDKASSSVR